MADQTELSGQPGTEHNNPQTRTEADLNVPNPGSQPVAPDKNAPVLSEHQQVPQQPLPKRVNQPPNQPMPQKISPERQQQVPYQLNQPTAPQPIMAVPQLTEQSLTSTSGAIHALHNEISAQNPSSQTAAQAVAALNKLKDPS